jgi:hypothetical protein
MGKVVNLLGAYQKQIVTAGEVESEDSALFLNKFLELLRKRFKVEVMIQSGVQLDKGKPLLWQCVIGRQLNDFADAQVFASGMGENFADCIVESLNEFIEYYGMNRNELLA